MDTEIKKLVTHNGSFHADDIFACATLCLMLEKNGEKFEITRTREPEIVMSGDYVFDIGGVYDPEKNKFDHHQKGGAGRRVSSGNEGEVGIEYASFGLVWKKFGIELCGSEKVSDAIDRKLIAPIDAGDNGVDLVETKGDVSPYFIQNLFSSMKPTWREKNLDEDDVFIKAVETAKEVLSREIIQSKDSALSEEKVLAIYESSKDKRVLVFDEEYPFQRALADLPEPLFVIAPRKINNTWGVKAVRANSNTFKNKKDFPSSWAGLRDAELQNITGVGDAVFCHRGLFLAVASSKEGAIKLAELAFVN